MSGQQPIPRAITSSQFVQALEKAGIVQRGDMIRRLVIDAQASRGLVMYIERYGDERLLDVALTLDGIKVTPADQLTGVAEREIPVRQRSPEEVRDRLLSGPLPPDLAVELACDLGPSQSGTT